MGSKPFWSPIALLVSRPEYPRDKPFLLTMVSYLEKSKKIKMQKRKKKSFNFYLFFRYETIVSRIGLSLGYSEQDTSEAVHRGAFRQFIFRWIYYYGSNESTGKKTGKTHLCALCASCGIIWFFLHVKIHEIASKKSYISKVHCRLKSWFFQFTDITGNPPLRYQKSCSFWVRCMIQGVPG